LPLSLLIAYFLFHEGIPNPHLLTFVDKLFFDGVVLMIAGLALSWKWELGGGLLTVGGYFLFTYAEGDFFFGAVFPLFLVLGLSNVLLWLLEKYLVHSSFLHRRKTESVV